MGELHGIRLELTYLPSVYRAQGVTYPVALTGQELPSGASENPRLAGAICRHTTHGGAIEHGATNPGSPATKFRFLWRLYQHTASGLTCTKIGLTFQ